MEKGNLERIRRGEGWRSEYEELMFEIVSTEILPPVDMNIFNAASNVSRR